MFCSSFWGLQGEEGEVDVVFPASVPEGTVEETVSNVRGIPAQGDAEPAVFVAAESQL